MSIVKNRSGVVPMQGAVESIGSKLRHARLVRGLRLKDVATEVGCSEGFISKIENGQSNPSINMVHRIAHAVGTNIAALFTKPDDGDIVLRKDERPRISSPDVSADGIALERLVPEMGAQLLQGTLHIIVPGGGSEGLISHDGEEFGFVLEGSLELQVESKKYLLNPGDTFFFSSHLLHGYRNPSDSTTRVIWVNTPPSY